MTHTERKMADAIFYELSSRNSPLDSPAQASIEVDDALEYRILAEEDGWEYRPECFSPWVGHSSGHGRARGARSLGCCETSCRGLIHA